MLSSSGRYTHIDGKGHRRVPFGCYKIGRVASGDDHKFLTNDAVNDPRVHNREWARELGLVSFAGYQLRVPGGEILGVLALFAKHPILAVEDAILDGVSSAVSFVVQQSIAEEALRASEVRNRTLIENLPQKIFLKDRNSVYISCNENYAQDLKIKAEEIKGKTDHDFHPKELVEKYRADDKRIIESGKTEDIEEKYIQAGQEKFVHTIKTPVKDEQGNIAGVLGIFWDITDRKKIEKERRLVELGKLVADIAHEINNPIAVISGRAQLFLMEKKIDENVEKVLKIIFKESQKVNNIVQRLLHFSKAGKQEFKEININSCLDELVNLLEHQFQLNNIGIERDYMQDLPLVWASEPQMQEVFINILNNAKDAMPEGGVIRITTSTKGDFLKIDFKDTGCGMTEEAMDRLFEPFFTTKEKGTGLGLSICYGIIQTHNGELKFTSEQGKGTMATAFLPLKGGDKNEEKDTGS